MKITQNDFLKLVAHVLKLSSRKDSSLHGEKHWKCVGWVGAHLLKATPEADANLVLLFSVLHDSMRRNDWGDPEHGERAAGFAKSLNNLFYQLSDADMKTLETACFYHNLGRTSDNPTIGVCWDADRLNLWRVGTTSTAKLLSTTTAKKPATIEWSRTIHKQHFTWEQVYVAYNP